MVLAPSGKLGEIWNLGTEHHALWTLLAVNARRLASDTITTSCNELGRHMAGPVLDRCKVIRLLQKLEGIGVLTLETMPKAIRVTIHREVA